MHYCGIDIAKRKHVLAVMDEKGEIVKAPFSVDNNRAGFEQLRDVLVAIPGQVTVGLEATGHYPGPRGQGGLAGSVRVPDSAALIRRCLQPAPDPRLSKERFTQGQKRLLGCHLDRRLCAHWEPATDNSSNPAAIAAQGACPLPNTSLAASRGPQAQGAGCAGPHLPRSRPGPTGQGTKQPFPRCF